MNTWRDENEKKEATTMLKKPKASTLCKVVY